MPLHVHSQRCILRESGAAELAWVWLGVRVDSRVALELAGAGEDLATLGAHEIVSHELHIRMRMRPISSSATMHAHTWVKDTGGGNDARSAEGFDA